MFRLMNDTKYVICIRYIIMPVIFPSWSDVFVFILQVKTLSFDQSGTYLAVGGSEVQVYLVKQWEMIKSFAEHSDVTTGVKFGKHASFIASVGLDRHLKFYSR